MTSSTASTMFRCVALCSAQALLMSQIAYPVSAQAPVERVPPAQTLTVPAGTTIPLTLVSPIKQKTTHVGDGVRAQVAFPITVGTQVAIPAGTYVEGLLQAITPATRKNPASVKVHFTRLVYANGYTVALNAENTEASVAIPAIGASAPVEMANAGADPSPFAPRMAFYGGEGFAGQFQPLPTPTLTPPPNPGPPMGLVMGVTLGAVAALGIVSFALMHHRAARLDTVLFDSGWQFQMTLDTALTVDAAQATAAPAVPAS